jgi:hypothetical protein
MAPSPPGSPAADELARLIRSWYDLEYATDHTPQQRAWVATAVEQADTAARAAAIADGGEPLAHRDAAWFRHAHQTYQLLRSVNAYADLHAPVPRCAADPEAIRTWLAAPSDQPNISNAEQLGVHTLDLDSPTLPGDLNTLVVAAGEARVFGVPGHHVELWIVTDNDQVVDGHLLTVDCPDGTRLASAHLPTDHLIDSGRRGLDAAVGVLVNAAAEVNRLLERPYARTGSAAAALASNAFTRHAAASPVASAPPGTSPTPTTWPGPGQGGVSRGR